MGPNTIKENIYADHSTNEVTFVNTEEPEEIMNCITTNSAGVRSLEFYRRDSNTKERLEWSVPKHIALNGIQACIDRATRILESQSK